ncbi:MAG: hypothetical protein JW841_00330 [Deltaproteobacteria bacterium]|nr:hypothetical protein [Deltaproteobacteria bacterium]
MGSEIQYCEFVADNKIKQFDIENIDCQCFDPQLRATYISALRVAKNAFYTTRQGITTDVTSETTAFRIVGGRKISLDELERLITLVDKNTVKADERMRKLYGFGLHEFYLFCNQVGNKLKDGELFGKRFVIGGRLLKDLVNGNYGNAKNEKYRYALEPAGMEANTCDIFDGLPSALKAAVTSAPISPCAKLPSPLKPLPETYIKNKLFSVQYIPQTNQKINFKSPEIKTRLAMPKFKKDQKQNNYLNDNASLLTNKLNDLQDTPQLQDEFLIRFLNNNNISIITRFETFRTAFIAEDTLNITSSTNRDKPNITATVFSRLYDQHKEEIRSVIQYFFQNDQTEFFSVIYNSHASIITKYATYQITTAINNFIANSSLDSRNLQQVNDAIYTLSGLPLSGTYGLLEFLRNNMQTNGLIDFILDPKVSDLALTNFFFAKLCEKLTTTPDLENGKAPTEVVEFFSKFILSLSQERLKIANKYFLNFQTIKNYVLKHTDQFSNKVLKYLSTELTDAPFQLVVSG